MSETTSWTTTAYSDASIHGHDNQCVQNETFFYETSIYIVLAVVQPSYF